MDYKGVIIEESLSDKSLLGNIKILETKVEDVTEKHKTPWLKKWTLHTVEIPQDQMDKFISDVSNSIQKDYWYADFKNDKFHYIIYHNKIFKVDLQNPTLYQDARNYGISLGIPKYQVAFGDWENN